MLEPPPVRYAVVDGAHIAYQVVGEGPDLIVAPGFISHLDMQWSMASFVDYVERLASFSRVILFDKRSTGLSDSSGDADRFEQRADDILGVLDAVDSEQATLLGMSEGGPLAALFAASHPDRIGGLILYGTFARASTIDGDVLDEFEEAVDNWGQGLSASVFLAPYSRNRMSKSFFGLFERASCGPGMARSLFDSIKEADVRSILPSIDVPTLVLHRTDDPFASAGGAEELVELIPGAESELLEGDDHIPWLGDPTPIVAAVERFMSGGRATGPRPTRVRTAMFTDIVDSTKTAVRMGDAAWKDLLRQHNTTTHQVVESFNGRVIKSTGDGFLSLFDSPARAVRAAQELILALRMSGVEIRTGIHTGEVDAVDVGGDVTGVAVHLAARIGDLGNAGEILISATVRDLLIGEDLSFSSRGRQALKGIPDRVEVLALTDESVRAGRSLEPARLTLPDRLAIGALHATARMKRLRTRLSSV